MIAIRGFFISIVVAVFLSQGLVSQNKISDYLSYDGAVRTGFFTAHRTGRDGIISRADDWRLRLQLGIRADLSGSAFLRLRFAGRFSTDQERSAFIFKDHVTGSGGLQLGESTFDEIYLSLRPAEGWAIRLGRMQTKFELVGVPRKSLWRNDSPSTDVTWTDGVHVSRMFQNGWQVHLIAQYNSEKGGSTVFRSPLTFTEDASRIGVAAAVNRTERSGLFAQRELSITYLPSSLRVTGNQTEDPEDYLAVAAQTGIRFDAGVAGAQILLAGEVGYALNTQSEQLARIGESESERVDGLALQISFNVMNAYRNHNLGILYGDIGAGWLLSPDLRENNREVEVRYRWRITEKLNTEHRVRVRTDREKPVSADQKRKDVDLYFRFTFRL
jgi:hypothetical protein